MGAMCIGERIHIVARFGGKVFGQVQGDAALLLSLSFLPPFSFSPVRSLTNSPIVRIFASHNPLSPSLLLTNRLFCQFLAPPLFRSLRPVSFPLLSRVHERAVYKTHECTCTCVESTSSSSAPSRPAGIRAARFVSFRFVSFRFVFRL